MNFSANVYMLITPTGNLIKTDMQYMHFIYSSSDTKLMGTVGGLFSLSHISRKYRKLYATDFNHTVGEKITVCWMESESDFCTSFVTVPHQALLTCDYMITTRDLQPGF